VQEAYKNATAVAFHSIRMT